VNIGQTPATLIEASAMTYDYSPQCIPIYPEARPDNRTIQSGESLVYVMPVDTNFISEWDFQAGTGKPDTSCYCLGYIAYKDGVGRSYRTAFLRRYNGSLKRFTPVDNPDYEYQD
jgi:hypothetical protein